MRRVFETDSNGNRVPPKKRPRCPHCDYPVSFIKKIQPEGEIKTFPCAHEVDYTFGIEQ